MSNKNYIKKRIDIFAGKPIDPNSDAQVKDVLFNLNIKLPQKSLLDDALSSANDTHEIIQLIIQYRKMN